jgi:hypothetical protein
MSALPENLQIESVLSGMQPFQPTAYYDKHLDVIRVQIMDCSISEERVDKIMTIYHMNHHHRPDGLNDIAGFAIKGVRHLFKKLEIKYEGAILIAELLDKLVKMYPTTGTRRVIEFYRELGNKAPMEISLAA